MASPINLLAAAESRGRLQQHTPGLREHLATGPRTAYCGFDPTAPSLHAGNLVPVMMLRMLAQHGHRVVAVVGGGTAMIGDPSGKSVERPLLTAAEVAANAAAIGAQLERLVGANVRLVDNGEWLQPLGAIPFLRDVGKHFPVNQMLAKETVKSRLDAGISFTEFSYMLLQAYDFLRLFTDHGVTIQVGGSDQWGNITAGCELIRRSTGGEAHALTTPLLTAAGGKKFGKTEAGAVWLDAAKTSPFDFYQYWRNVDDTDVVPFLRLFTDEPDESLAECEASLKTEPQARRAHTLLARLLTTLVHGEDQAAAAQTASAFLFTPGQDYGAFDDREFGLMNALAGRAKTDIAAGQRDVDVVALTHAAFDTSKSEARRLLSQGGLSVNGEKLASTATTIPLTSAIRGRWFVVKRGSQKIAVVELVQK